MVRYSMLAGLFCIGFAGTALAASESFRATLDGQQEVPPKNTNAKGEMTGTLDTDTHQFTYRVTYSGLSGPTTGAHFHGPAGPGQNGAVVLPITNPQSPAQGNATLNDQQVRQLENGQWYGNIHTQANPQGEIRGQVERAK